ncbi:MAG: glutaredoxin [Myxococcota bacterium]
MIVATGVMAGVMACGGQKAPAKANQVAPDPTSAPEIRVHADNVDLIYRYFPDSTRKAETVTSLKDVPQASRSMVLVIPVEVPPGLSYVADLTNAKPDGTYNYKVIPTAELDRTLDESRGSVASTATLAAATDPKNTPTRAASTASSATTKREDVVMFSTTWCGVCGKAKRWMRNKGIPFIERDIEKEKGARGDMQRLAKEANFPASQLSGVPVIWVKGKMFSGFNPRSIEAALN